ncbi:hypothetical protein SDC9_59723 [bioreactor metagenome]|uniref:Uncharacterized protein n=1 Tax=bioreactor metagenome TaxID=1076179 RepID=A0A644XAW1_9ZZZZ
MRNADVHERFKISGIKKWLCAEKLGISDVAFSKKLRMELSPEEKKKIFEIIEELKNENVN